MSRARRAAVVLLAVPLLAVLAPSGAHAHDQLVSSDPADGQVLTAPPTQVVLTFSSQVIDLSQDVQLTLPDGQRRDGLDVVVGGSTVTATLPDGLGGGEYGVQWRVVSGDGHPIEGSFRFTVDAPAATPSDAAAPTGPATASDTPAPDVTPEVTASAATPDASAPTDPDDASGTSGWAWVAGLLGAAAVASVLVARRRR